MIHTQDADFTLYQGDVLEQLRGLPDESVHCCVTSPPYWGLRDYGADGQIGLEATPELYVARMVGVFREVRRVLRSDGTCWLNLGDSYNAYNGGAGPGSKLSKTQTEQRPQLATGYGLQCKTLKPKDLVGIPWRVAFALQQPYYTGRIAAERDRVWLAAIIDGEGTICGMRHVRKGTENVRTGCMVFVTNTSEALLDECDRIWPGSRYTEKLTSEVSRPCWRWELQSAEDRSALVRELYPYLIEKKQQALVAWNLLELVLAAKKLGRGGESGETKAKRDLLVRVLSDLNQRRPVDPPSWLLEPPSLHEPGWYLRSDVIWSKSNPMPESVTDRPTKSHEYLFLCTKSARYFFDQEAVREEAEYGRRKWTSVDGNLAGVGIDGKRGHATVRDFRKPPQEDTLDGGPGKSPRGPDGRRQTHVEGRDGSLQHRDGERWPNGGRNVRSVWEIATQPYAEAHFATYPEELVRRCIAAGTSERGCCPECGAPWERETETSYEKSPVHGAGSVVGRHYETGANNFDGAGMPRLNKVVETTGWTRTCELHDEEKRLGAKWYAPIPCTVLDPFLGSGTTAHVARKLGRRSIGIELNPDYCRLAARRMQQQSLFAEAA